MIVPPRLILAPIDFSEFSNAAVDVAADLAAQFHSELCLAYVVPAIPKLPSGVSILKEGEYENELHREAEDKLQKLCDGLKQRGLKAEYETGTANAVPQEILRIAEHKDADLIVIATHGATAWNRMMFGSVAEKVVHLAPCPVLILKTHHEAKRHSEAESGEPVRARG
jgi:nucleotide-binding universal stress UspA family protein